MATPFVVPPSPDIEQQCRQLQDSPRCGLPESRQHWLLWKLSAISVNRIVFPRSTEPSAHTPPRELPEFSLSSSWIDRFRPLLRESSRLMGDALLPLPADDCLCSFVDTPDSVGHCEPFPGSEYRVPLPASATVRLVLSAGSSGASDWVGSQDLYHTAGEIIYLCIDHSLVRPIFSDDSPIRGSRGYEKNPPRYALVGGVRRSAAYRWKPGIGITASSCSALRRRGLSECRSGWMHRLFWFRQHWATLCVCHQSLYILGALPGIMVIQPSHTCSRSRMNVGYCYSPLQLDDLMMELVGGWCFT